MHRKKEDTNLNTTVFKGIGTSKKYGTSFALRDVNMTIKSGEIYGLVGENGAGKTTLMKIISGLVFPTEGMISLFGKSEKKELNEARTQIGVLLELPAFYPRLNAAENLKFYSYIHNITDKSRITEVLEQVSLADVGDKKAMEFSLGMKQRLGLAIALLNKPKFLVLDEPINGIDPTGIVEVRKILKRLASENGITILISSHILSELQLLATKIGFIHRGHLIKEIETEVLLKTAETLICIQTPTKGIDKNILKAKLQVDSIAITESGEIQIPKNNIELETLIQVLLSLKIKVENINILMPSLENYYLDLIGGME